MTILSEILMHKIVAIVRGARPEDVIEIAGALYEGGVRCMEVTLNSDSALQVIENVAVKMAGRMVTGAGTVLDAAAASSAIAAGAAFIVSPIMDIETIRQTKKLGAVSIPGAFTPTEIFKAHVAGGDIIKVFPSSSGPGFIKEILAPLPGINLMPTGGISLANIGGFYNAGAVAFGIGKSLVDTTQKVSNASLQKIIANAKAFMQVVNANT